MQASLHTLNAADRRVRSCGVAELHDKAPMVEGDASALSLLLRVFVGVVELNEVIAIVYKVALLRNRVNALHGFCTWKMRDKGRVNTLHVRTSAGQKRANQG